MILKAIPNDVIFFVCILVYPAQFELYDIYWKKIKKYSVMIE